MMDKIYGHADDKYVRQYHLYGKSTSDAKVYIDSDYKTQAKTSELKNAFLKGAYIDIGGKFYALTSYSETSNVGSVIILTAGGSNAATLVTMSAVADA